MSYGELMNGLPTRPLREVLLRALGGVLPTGSPEAALNSAIKTQLSAVGFLAYHLWRSSTLYTCTILTSSALIRMEVFPDGSNSIRVVPLRQVRQVSEQKSLVDGKVLHEIVIEFNAGVTETVTTPEGSVAKPGGWVLLPERTPDGVVSTSSSDQMVLFGAQLRHLLASSPV